MGEHLQEAVPDGSAAVRYQPYPEYTLTNDERLLQLPVHWNIAPLRYLLNEPLTNGLFKKREHWGSGLRIVNVFDVYIKGDVVQETSLERVSCDITEQKKYSAEHGDFFFVRSSLKLEGIGKSASVLNPTEPMVFECHLVRGRPNTDTVCPKYLSYILNSSYCRQSLISLANQVTMTTIDQEKFKSLKISYPDLHEQQTIAAFLDYKTAKIDALIAKKKALLDKLAEKRTALISHAVTKGLDPGAPMRDSGIDWLGEIPAHWETKRIKHLLKPKKAAIKTGPFGSQLQSSEMNDSEVKVYNQKNVISQDLKGGNNYISFEKYRDLIAFEVFPNDLLVTTRGTIGRCLIVPHDAEKGILHPCLMRLQINQKQILNSYLKVLIGESGFVFEHLKLMSNATTIEVIYSESLKEVWLPIPPVDEQYKILEHLNESIGELEAFTHKVEIVITRLQEYRSALITNAVTGKIDVRNFRLPEAEELVNHGG